jgi:hypothetical protein
VWTGSQQNVLNRNFESPVHLAVHGGKLDVLELLVRAGKTDKQFFFFLKFFKTLAKPASSSVFSLAK